jgi:hypothetical protein
MVQSLPAGIALTTIAGFMSGNCMLPLKFLRKWKWENATAAGPSGPPFRSLFDRWMQQGLSGKSNRDDLMWVNFDRDGAGVDLKGLLVALYGVGLESFIDRKQRSGEGHGSRRCTKIN